MSKIVINLSVLAAIKNVADQSKITQQKS